MSLITDYVIIEEAYTSSLETVVKQAMKDGWQPLGGPTHMRTMWHQAMVKRDWSQGDLIASDIHDLNNKTRRE